MFSQLTVLGRSAHFFHDHHLVGLLSLEDDRRVYILLSIFHWDVAKVQLTDMWSTVHSSRAKLSGFIRRGLRWRTFIYPAYLATFSQLPCTITRDNYELHPCMHTDREIVRLVTLSSLLVRPNCETTCVDSSCAILQMFIFHVALTFSISTTITRDPSHRKATQEDAAHGIHWYSHTRVCCSVG
jgi:hypothetical protein